MKMERNPKQYGVQARKLIIDATLYMLKNKICLNPNNFRSEGKPSIYGWLNILNGGTKGTNALLINILNQLTTLVMD